VWQPAESWLPAQKLFVTEDGELDLSTANISNGKLLVTDTLLVPSTSFTKSQSQISLTKSQSLLREEYKKENNFLTVPVA
jgi:hypothetical protein